MNDEKTLVLKHSERGFSIVSGELAESPQKKDAPKESDICTPRWAHWHQRKLARIRDSVMLSMNIEPSAAARAALKKFRPEQYKEYSDRLDIAMTLAGWDFKIYEDHLREGDSAGDKYVALVEFYNFAKSLKWTGLEAMSDGLQLKTNPPKSLSLQTKNAAESNRIATLHRLVLGLVQLYAPHALGSETDLLKLKGEIAKVVKKAGWTLDVKTIDAQLKDVWTESSK